MANEERNWLLEFQKQLIDALKLPRDRTWFGTGLLEVVKAKVAKLEVLESVSRPDLEAVAREQVEAVMEAAQGPHTGRYETDAEAWPHCGLDSDQFHTVLLGVLREHFPATPAPTVGAQKDWVSDSTIRKMFFTQGYITGDHECFCIASAIEPCYQDKDNRVYPDEWFEHLDNRKHYRFKITVEAEEAPERVADKPEGER